MAQLECKSKHSVYFYANIGLMLFMSFLLLALLVSLVNKHPISIMLIIPIVFFMWWMLKFYKTAPSVTITDTNIILNKLVETKHVFIDDICEFQLTNSFHISKWIDFNDTNGFSIRTKTGEEYIFYEKLYKNPHDLRARLAQIAGMDFVPRDSAIDNPLTILSSPLSFKTNIIIFCVGLATLPLILLDLPTLALSIIFLISIYGILGSIFMTIDDIYYFLTIKVEGKEIHFKRKMSFRKEIKVKFNDIITCNISFLNIRNKYTGYAFCYITSDFRRIVIKGDNLTPEVWNKFIDILEKNNVPVTNLTFEC